MATASKSVILSGVDMSFFALVGLFVKLSLAMIPATIIVSVVFALAYSVLGALLLGVLGVAGSA